MSYSIQDGGRKKLDFGLILLSPSKYACTRSSNVLTICNLVQGLVFVFGMFVRGNHGTFEGSEVCGSTRGVL